MITPAQTFLNKNKIHYTTYEYDCSVDHDFGRFAASALQIDPNRVFKTIMLHQDKTYVTCIVPVNAMISLKNLARACKIKKLEMTDQATASKITGYVIGGISPFGQKRKTMVVLNDSALNYDEILVSGGRRGFSVGVNPYDLIKALDALCADITEHADAS